MEFSTSTSPWQPIILNHGAVSPTDHPPPTHPAQPSAQEGHFASWTGLGYFTCAISRSSWRLRWWREVMIGEDNNREMVLMMIATPMLLRTKKKTRLVSAMVMLVAAPPLLREGDSKEKGEEWHLPARSTFSSSSAIFWFA